jgi:quercetin dioxygenase-like cupin family protein
MPSPLRIDDLPGSETAHLFEGRDYGSTVSSFITHNPPGTGPGLHRHPYEETFIVVEGTVTFTVDGEAVEAQGGQIVIAPAGAPHKFVNSGEGLLRLVTIHPSDHVEQEWLEEDGV